MMTRPRVRPAITGFIGVFLIFSLGLSPGLTSAADVDDILLEQANQAGSVRVQVELAAPTEPDQAEEIDRIAEDVLFALPSGSYQAVERQTGSARMSLQVDAAALDALSVASEVAAITPAAMPGAMRRLAAGTLHSHAIEPDGSLWAWGSNENGQLGTGTTLGRRTRGQVLTDVAGVTTGGDTYDAGDHRFPEMNYALAIKTDGSLWSWGSNDYGQLGTGTTLDRWTPASIMGGVTAVAAGAYHSLAVTSDTGLWAWGANWTGQLGDGSTTGQTSPKLIMYNVAEVAAGYHHTLALKTDGSLYAWGANYSGQLGTGNTNNIATPFYIDDGVIAIAAGDYHSLALKADGSLWSWGSNGSGQLGDGTTINRMDPVQVLTGVIAMSAGRYHTLALTDNGSLLAWGSNGSGQLGDGTRTNRTSPVRVLTNVAAMTGGGYHSIARKTDGSLWSWGYNLHGQLGDGTTTRRLLPVPVLGFTPTLPAAPTNLAATAASSTQINLSWSDNSTNEQGFRIQRNTGGTTWAHVATVSPNTTSYLHSNLSAGTTYTYRVVAFDASGTLSNYSNTASATTQGGSAGPAAPTGLTATVNSSSKITLRWTDRSNNERNFRIERRTASSDWTQIGQVRANITTYANTGLAAGTAYSYRVLANNAAGVSGYSNEVTATTQGGTTAKPAAPSNLVARAASRNQINLTWQDRSTNEQGFRIERRIGTAPWVQIAEVAANSTSFANLGLSPNTAYRYRVRAFNAGGTSVYATARAVRTPR